ncbi:hypothetical protein C0993_004918 [Termitomyces sp. T159_Od127]|nr:hypothetical protein C0993_004918 [Termitomyces sp. T159_Od127]
MVATNSYIKKRDIEAAIILSIGTSISNYPELKLYQERVDEWHRHNLGTGTLSSNANSDADQHIQQQLIYEVLHLDSVEEKGGLSKESSIAALEKELNAFKNQVFDRVEIPRPKQPLKGYKSMATATNNPTPPAPGPSTPPITAPADSTPPVANISDSLLLLHPYSRLNNCYQPLAQHNFGTPDKQANGTYQLTAPVYNIEKSN